MAAAEVADVDLALEFSHHSKARDCRSMSRRAARGLRFGDGTVDVNAGRPHVPASLRRKVSMKRLPDDETANRDKEQRPEVAYSDVEQAELATQKEAAAEDPKDTRKPARGGA